jgi:hypothetical protein
VPSAIVFSPYNTNPPNSGATVSLSGGAVPFTLFAVYLDASNNVTGVQNLAVPVTVSFSDSNPTAGTFSTLAFPSGTFTANGTFTPLASGQSTTITAIQPTGFTVPAAGGAASPALGITVVP